MGTPQWSLHTAALAAALASAIAFGGMTPAAAVPAIVPDAPAVRPDVVQVQNSTIIRRENSHHDGRAWKKRRHHRDAREHSREHARDHDDGGRKFRPRATPKYAYDAYGNYRTYDGDGWDDGDKVGAAGTRRSANTARGSTSVKASISAGLRRR